MGSSHRRTAAVQFNATNHEFYRIPRMYNVFDPSLAVRVVPGPTKSIGDARKIQSTIVWEQVIRNVILSRTHKSNSLYWSDRA
jgi:hypothetical protein